MHKLFSTVLQEEIIKPLKNLYESQTKSRKPVAIHLNMKKNKIICFLKLKSSFKIEANVEKVNKTLSDARAKDYKVNKKKK